MKNLKFYLSLIAIVILPAFSFAQGTADNLHSFQSVLTGLYDKMIPLCEKLINVGRGLAGFGALFYIAARVWRHLANAEPIDFYPLFRPFALGLCITYFTGVLALLNGVLRPLETGTRQMVDDSNIAVKHLLKQKEESLKGTDMWKMYIGQSKEGDRDAWYRYTHKGEDPADEGAIHAVVSRVQFEIEKAAFKFKNSVREYMSEVLTVLFEAAALCINTLRTFQLVILSILGPIVFGIAVFDGLQHTLTAWIAKFINIFLWVPVANIFSALIGNIQEELIKLDIEQLKNTGETFFGATDTGYIIFLLIGIVGYFTVPSVSNFIVNAGGGGAMAQKITSMVSSSPSMAMSTMGRMGSGADNIANMGRHFNEGLSGTNGGSGGAATVGRVLGTAYMVNRLSGGDSKKKEDK